MDAALIGFACVTGVTLAVLGHRMLRRSHQHDWERWSDMAETKVYAAGLTRAETENRLPIRREYRQHRTCRTCGEYQSRMVCT